MFPILFHIGPLPVRSYAVFIALAFVVAGVIRRSEAKRLAYDKEPGHQWVGVGALLGAILGAKLGMVFFEPLDGFAETLQRMAQLDFAGKTVVGGLIGGFIGVEITKNRVGITHSTGDAWALALPAAQAVGRLGCYFEGCCYGSESENPWSVVMHGASRHPAQLYEAGLLLVLLAILSVWRSRPMPEGHLFRRYLVGYAVIRFTVEFARGDPSVDVGPFSLVQIVCMMAAVGFVVSMWRQSRGVGRVGG